MIYLGAIIHGQDTGRDLASYELQHGLESTGCFWETPFEVMIGQTRRASDLVSSGPKKLIRTFGF